MATGFLSCLAANISPYTAGEQLNDRKYVKLNTNENPYPPAPQVAQALSAFDADMLRLYPAPNADGLRAAIAKKEHVRPENIFCGNGSDEVLALCYPAFFDPDGKGACFADITYSFYPVFAEFFRIPQRIVPLDGEFRIDLEAFSCADCQGYFIANPNAPTGVGICRKDILSFAERNGDRLVIVDEAYMDFFGESVAGDAPNFSNLLVVKTFSKSYSLAGIRCGYAVGNNELIEGLFRVKDCFNSYPLDRVCQSVCEAAVQAEAYYAGCTEMVCRERERVRDGLTGMGFFVPYSRSNFLFAGNRKTGGQFIYRSLRERAVLVRYWNKPALRDFVRITIGTAEQNDVLLAALRDILDDRRA